ncbi:MAG: hypothetical protein PQJ50_12080 [Spirochaetales bacterium]|nr:hypothetical protein [Spirochaetales bacterium]
MKLLTKYLLPIILLMALPLTLSAENIRGPVSGTLVIDSLKSTKTVTTGIEEITGIVINELSPLVQGVRLTVKAAPDMALYRNSFALYIYRNLDRDYSEELQNYRGSQAMMRFLSFSDDLNILIPLNGGHTLSPDRSSVLLSDSSQADNFPFLVTILPITKGIPDSVYSNKMILELSPVYFNKGLLQLNLMDETAQSITEGVRISIDKKSYELSEDPFILNAGIHTLTIRSDDGSEESLPFSLEAGQTLILDHVLQVQPPLLSIEAMEGLEVYLDGRRLSEEEIAGTLEIQPGSHSIRFELGDFRMSRDFTAEMQQRITITMVPEILLEIR